MPRRSRNRYFDPTQYLNGREYPIDPRYRGGVNYAQQRRMYAPYMSQGARVTPNMFSPQLAFHPAMQRGMLNIPPSYRSGQVAGMPINPMSGLPYSSPLAMRKQPHWAGFGRPYQHLGVNQIGASYGSPVDMTGVYQYGAYGPRTRTGMPVWA